MINLQAVLLDDGGNVVTDKQEADIVFSVVDIEGETLYEEVQHVPIVYGAISVLVGRGKDVASGMPTGGIPMEALIPDGTKLLRIKLNEQSIPQEDLQLVSVPYALYAERISHPIESDEILDGTLIQADLSTELLSFITDSISGVNATSISAHRTESGAHPASSITVTNTFTHAAGTNLQQILAGLDSAIGTRRNQEGELMKVDAAILASEISRAGDTIYGDLSFYADDTLATQTMSIAPSTGDITTQGQVSALGGMFTIELDPTNSEPIISVDNTGGVETYRFEAETGSLTLRGDLTIADADILMSPGRLVDGVDVSELGNLVPEVPNDDNGDGKKDLNDLYVNITGDTMTGGLTAPSFSGDGAGITNIDGGNIQTDTITSAQIGENGVGSSEIAADAVGFSEIATGAVGSDEVVDGSVGAGDLNFSADTGAGGQSIDERFVNESDLPDFSNWDQNVSDDLTMAAFTGWDDNASNDLTTSTSFEGDVSSVITDVGGVKHVDLQVSSSGHDHPHTHDYAPPHDHPYAPAGHTHSDLAPPSPLVLAFAHGSGSTSGGCTGRNIGASGPFAAGAPITCNLSPDPPSSNYTVIAIPTGGGCARGIYLTVTDKDPGDFTITPRCFSDSVTSAWSFDFVVYRRD